MYLANDNAIHRMLYRGEGKNTLPGAGKSLSLWRQRKIHCAGNFSWFSLHINHCLSRALRGDGGWERREIRLPWENVPGAPCTPLCFISPASADHCQRDCIVSLTPHPASSTRWLRVPRTGNLGAPRCASFSYPFQTPHAAWTPSPPRQPAPPDLQLPSLVAPKPGVPRPPLPPTLRCDPTPAPLSGAG